MSQTFCGEMVEKTSRFELRWRVGVAHQISGYQVTEKGEGPWIPEPTAIRLAGRLLEDALSKPWLAKKAQRVIEALAHQITKR